MKVVTVKRTRFDGIGVGLDLNDAHGRINSPCESEIGGRRDVVIATQKNGERVRSRHLHRRLDSGTSPFDARWDSLDVATVADRQLVVGDRPVSLDVPDSTLVRTEVGVPSARFTHCGRSEASAWLSRYRPVERDTEDGQIDPVVQLAISHVLDFRNV